MPKFSESQIRAANNPVKARELQPIAKVPVWRPMQDRAFRTMMERIETDKRVATFGRK